MSFTLQQSPFLAPLFGDAEIAGLFSSEADLSAMLRFETALAQGQANHGFISKAAAQEIATKLKTFKPDQAKLSAGVSQDGMIVPALVSQLKAAINQHVHFGATSQDAIDTSLMLRTRQAFQILQHRIDGLIVRLEMLAKSDGKHRLMARTRMQQALPMTVADRLATWRTGISDARAAVEACRFPLQFGGPIGILSEFGDKASGLKSDLALSLELEFKADNWHSSRAPILALGNAASQVTGALGKIGADFCLMAQNEVAEVKFSDAGTSSAMQHKQNPIVAEALVTLARFNATLISGLHHSMVHEQERSGAAWALEWLLLPQIIVAAGAATRQGERLFGSILGMGHP